MQRERIVDQSGKPAAFTKQARHVKLALVVREVAGCDQLSKANNAREGSAKGLAPERYHIVVADIGFAGGLLNAAHRHARGTAWPDGEVDSGETSWGRIGAPHSRICSTVTARARTSPIAGIPSSNERCGCLKTMQAVQTPRM